MVPICYCCQIIIVSINRPSKTCKNNDILTYNVLENKPMYYDLHKSDVV